MTPWSALNRGFSARELGFCAPRQDLMIPVRSSVAADAHLKKTEQAFTVEYTIIFTWAP